LGSVDRSELRGYASRRVSRGRRKFFSIADFPFTVGRRSNASRQESIAELAGDYGIRDIARYVEKVRRVETIYER
jgi:hypothetical protein